MDRFYEMGGEVLRYIQTAMVAEQEVTTQCSQDSRLVVWDQMEAKIVLSMSAVAWSLSGRLFCLWSELNISAHCLDCF